MTAAARLSVCCLTADDPAMVAAALATLRDVADEIVVAVDSRVDPASTGPLRDVADTVVRFEYTDPPESARPWLVGLCRHDRVLMVDGDEVPGTALVAALPELAADGDTAQFRLARRWCFPDERHWLAERPWWPDYQRRLVVKGRSSTSTPQSTGVPAPRSPPATSTRLYHLACTITPFAERRARAPLRGATARPRRRRRRPDERHPLRPRALRHAPARARPRRRPRRAPDRAGRPGRRRRPAGRAAGDGSRSPPRTRSPGPCRRTRSWPRATGSPRRVVERDRRTEPGNDTLIAVEVANRGDAPLPHRDGPGVQLRVGARLIDQATGAPLGAWASPPSR